MANPNPIPIRVSCSVVPDGVGVAGQPAKVSVVMEPGAPGLVGETIVDLAQWPTEITGRGVHNAQKPGGGLYLFLYDAKGVATSAIGGGQTVDLKSGSATTAPAFSDSALAWGVKSAQDLWTRTFARDGQSGFEGLLDFLFPGRTPELSQPKIDVSLGADIHHAPLGAALEKLRSNHVKAGLRAANARASGQTLEAVAKNFDHDVAAAVMRPFSDAPLRRDWRAKYQAFLADDARGAFGNLDLVIDRGTAPAKASVTSSVPGELQPAEEARITEYFRTWRGRAAPETSKVRIDGVHDYADRKYTAIRSHPALMKFLRLVVDVSIDPALLADGFGLIGAAVLDDAPDLSALRLLVQKANRTAFQTRRTNGALTYFEVASSAEFGMPSAVPSGIADGVLHLDPARFSLESMDVHAAMASTKSRAGAVDEGHRKGASEDQIDPSLPEIRTRGLGLMDANVRDVLKASSAFRDSLKLSGRETWRFSGGGVALSSGAAMISAR